MPDGPTTISASGGQIDPSLLTSPDAGGFLPAPDPLAGTGITRAINPLNPAESPTFQQFLRRQRAGAAAARAAIEKQRAALERQQSRTLEDFGIDELRGSRAIAEDFESRGLSRSSGRRTAEGEYLGDVERSRSRFLEDIGLRFDELNERAGRIGSGGGAARQRLLDRIRRDQALELARRGIIPTLG